MGGGISGCGYPRKSAAVVPVVPPGPQKPAEAGPAPPPASRNEVPDADADAAPPPGPPPRDPVLTSGNRSMVMIGNPGTGKSTTMNCFLGVHLFHSGTSRDGVGVTFQLDVKEHNGLRCMDTPGLADMKLRKAAAEAIQRALRLGGDFQIVFVCKLDGNRIRADDLLTVKLVLEAANQIKPNDYAIMFNQSPPKELEKMDKTKFISNLNDTFAASNVATTKYVHFAKRIYDLEGEDNVLVALPPETQNFLMNVPRLTIDGEKVEDVNAAGFDDILQDLEESQNARLEAQEARIEAEKREEEARQQQKNERAAREAAEAASKTAAAYQEMAEKLQMQAEKEKDDAVKQKQLAQKAAEAALNAQIQAELAKKKEEERFAAEKLKLKTERLALDKRKQQQDGKNVEQKKLLEAEVKKKEKEAEEAARKAKLRYYYWSQYGNNATCLYECTKSEWEDNKGTYPVCKSTGTKNTTFWFSRTKKHYKKDFDHPSLTYCGTGYWYGYFQTNTDLIHDTGYFDKTDPMDLIDRS